MTHSEFSTNPSDNHKHPVVPFLLSSSILRPPLFFYIENMRNIFNKKIHTPIKVCVLSLLCICEYLTSEFFVIRYSLVTDGLKPVIDHIP